MKRLLIPLTVLLIIVAWGNFIYGAIMTPREYQNIVKQADSAYEKELYFEAINKYFDSKEIKEDLSVDLKILDSYKKLGESDNYIRFALSMIEKYPDQVQLYEKVALRYQEMEKYGDLVAFLDKHYDMLDKSENLQKIYLEVDKRYDYFPGDIMEIQLFRGELAAVLQPNIPVEIEETIDNKDSEASDEETDEEQYKDLWMLVGSTYEQLLEEYYEGVQVSEDYTTCFVKEPDGKWKAINVSGYMIAKNDERDFEQIGPMSSVGLATAVANGKYCLINQQMLVAEVPFDYVSNFSEGVAAVRKGDRWALVNAENWSNVADYPYEEVAINLEECCVYGGISVVKVSGKYYLLNEKGEKVSENAYDELKAFESDQPTGYRQGEKWGFVNRYGEVYIEAQYEDVLPFTNGYAAVKKEGLWGYINKDNVIVVEPQFKEALPIFSTGIGFVKGENDAWGHINLYMLKYASK